MNHIDEAAKDMFISFPLGYCSDEHYSSISNEEMEYQTNYPGVPVGFDITTLRFTPFAPIRFDLQSLEVAFTTLQRYWGHQPDVMQAATNRRNYAVQLVIDFNTTLLAVERYCRACMEQSAKRAVVIQAEIEEVKSYKNDRELSRRQLGNRFLSLCRQNGLPDVETTKESFNNALAVAAHVSTIPEVPVASNNRMHRIGGIVLHFLFALLLGIVFLTISGKEPLQLAWPALGSVLIFGMSYLSKYAFRPKGRRWPFIALAMLVAGLTTIAAWNYGGPLVTGATLTGLLPLVYSARMSYLTNKEELMMQRTRRRIVRTEQENTRKVSEYLQAHPSLVEARDILPKLITLDECVSQANEKLAALLQEQSVCLIAPSDPDIYRRLEHFNNLARQAIFEAFRAAGA